METCSYYPHLNNHSSRRALAMVLALVSAIVLSPLYVDSRLEARWSCGGLVLPAVVGGLIFAIRTTTGSSKNKGSSHSHFESADDDNGGWLLRIGSSSWGLAGILILLLFVVSWQDSVQHFFWR